MELKTYIKTNVNSSRLDVEIINSNSVSNYLGHTTNGNNLSIYGESILNESVLDSVIDAHEEVNLNEYKQKRYNEIDLKTQYLISLGFVFDSHTFSLSLPAQSNWTNLKANADLLNSQGFFPITISTSDNLQYSLSYANVVPFWFAGFGVISTVYKGGSDLKVLVMNATTKEEVDLIIDNR
jgi:hypothetical protein